MRKSCTPQKTKQRISINAMDEYMCLETTSCESHTRPMNLRNMLRDQFNQGKSGKKIDDSESFVTMNYFTYP